MGTVSSILCCQDKRQWYEGSDPVDTGDEESKDSCQNRAKRDQLNAALHMEGGLMSGGQQSNDQQAQEKQGGQEIYSADDNLSDYSFECEDSDQEIEDLKQLRNEYEETMAFSKKGLKRHIDSTFEFEDSEEEKRWWELKLDKEEVRIFIKKNGSTINKDHPYVKAQVVFNSAFSMHKIAEAIFSDKHRLKWDKNVNKYEIIRLDAPHKNSQITYQVNKGVLNMNNRDFVDKQIKFSSDGSLYCYYSSIPEDTTIRECPNKTDRATTLVGIGKFSRREKDGKIVYQMLMQCDLKMKITPKLIAMFLPSGLQDWSRKINKYINDNYEKL